MNQMEVISLVFFIFFSFFFFDVCAQHGPDDNNGRLRPIQPGIAVVIGILSVTLSLTFLVLSCAKFCGTNGRDGLGDEDGQRGLLRSRSRFSGIDTKVIESLPFFRFSSLKGSKKGLECVVCLSKFEDSETLRLLPKCRHAFHMDCIDKWLERHSSCPLCRYKFDVADLTNFSHTNSLRYPQTTPNLADNLNLELFVKREGDRSSRSSRFNLGSSFQKFGKGKKEETLIQYDNRKLLDKFKHRIIVSDIVCKSRWSDVNSSDLMFLNSEMLNVMSSNRFSPLNSASNSGKFHSGLSMDEEIMKVKEDMERKRLYDSKVSKITRSYSSASASSLPSTSNTKTDPNKSTTMLRSLDPAVKRSMSEITNISRFTEFSTRNGIKESLFWGNNGNDDRIRNVWLPIARKTVQWFAGRERNSLRSESKREPSSV